MNEVVLDASALLALLNAEPGAALVAECLPGASISAVNLSEVVATLSGAGMPEKIIRQALEPLDLEVIPFDGTQAYGAGLLRAETRTLGLSLGDRACINLGISTGREILTADKNWSGLPDAAVRQIR